MEYKRIKKDDTYVCPLICKDMPSGFVEVGGSVDDLSGRWVARVSAEKSKGLFGGYKIKEDANYPGDYVEVGRSLTLSGAEKKVARRINDLAKLISEQTGLPIVDFSEAQKQKELADRMHVERMKAQLQE